MLLHIKFKLKFNTEVNPQSYQDVILNEIILNGLRDLCSEFFLGKKTHRKGKQNISPDAETLQMGLDNRPKKLQT